MGQDSRGGRWEGLVYYLYFEGGAYRVADRLGEGCGRKEEKGP